MAFMAFLGYINVFLVRNNINLAIVAMVNYTAIRGDGGGLANSSNPGEGQCGSQSPNSTGRSICLLFFLFKRDFSAFFGFNLSKPRGRYLASAQALLYWLFHFFFLNFIAFNFVYENFYSSHFPNLLWLRIQCVLRIHSIPL